MYTDIRCVVQRQEGKMLNAKKAFKVTVVSCYRPTDRSRFQN